MIASACQPLSGSRAHFTTCDLQPLPEDPSCKSAPPYPQARGPVDQFPGAAFRGVQRLEGRGQEWGLGQDQPAHNVGYTGCLTPDPHLWLYPHPRAAPQVVIESDVFTALKRLRAVSQRQSSPVCLGFVTEILQRCPERGSLPALGSSSGICQHRCGWPLILCSEQRSSHVPVHTDSPGWVSRPQ